MEQFVKQQMKKLLLKVQGMGGEDFAFMSRKKPSVQFNIGCQMKDPDLRYPVHNPKFMMDEDCLAVGVKVFLQFVLDNMNGIDFDQTAPVQPIASANVTEGI